MDLNTGYYQVITSPVTFSKWWKRQQKHPTITCKTVSHFDSNTLFYLRLPKNQNKQTKEPHKKPKTKHRLDFSTLVLLDSPQNHTTATWVSPCTDNVTAVKTFRPWYVFTLPDSSTSLPITHDTDHDPPSNTNTAHQKWTKQLSLATNSTNTCRRQYKHTALSWCDKHASFTHLNPTSHHVTFAPSPPHYLKRAFSSQACSRWSTQSVSQISWTRFPKFLPWKCDPLVDLHFSVFLSGVSPYSSQVSVISSTGLGAKHVIFENQVKVSKVETSGTTSSQKGFSHLTHTRGLIQQYKTEETHPQGVHWGTFIISKKKKKKVNRCFWGGVWGRQTYSPGVNYRNTHSIGLTQETITSRQPLHFHPVTLTGYTSKVRNRNENGKIYINIFFPLFLHTHTHT